jgi:hypothetical protein
VTGAADVRRLDALTTSMQYRSLVATMAAGDPDIGLSVDVDNSNGHARPPLATLAAIPSLQRPKLLLPLDHPESLRRSLSGYSAAGSRTAKAAAHLLEFGMRTGVARHVIRRRVHMHASSGCLQDTLPLLEHLGGVVGCPVVAVAIRLALSRPNSKPVLQLLTPEGEILGYAKIGWEAHTRRLVRGEAATLARLRGLVPAPRAFDIPHVIHHGQFGDLEVLVVEPFATPAWFRASRVDRLPIEATVGVMGLAPRSDFKPLGDTAYWRSVVERTQHVSGEAHPPLRALVDAVGSRYRSFEVELASAHGDWQSANMMRSTTRLHVWDWERFVSAAPAGLDAAHFHFNVARTRFRSDRTAVRSALDATQRSLPDLGLAPRAAELLLVLALLEMVVRIEESRAAGLTVDGRNYRSALISLLHGT